MTRRGFRAGSGSWTPSGPAPGTTAGRSPPPSPLEDIAVTEHPFPLPWIVKEITGGYTVLDANGTSLAYFYVRTSQVSREHARLLAMNFARLPALLGDDHAAVKARRDSSDLTWWNGSLAAG
jgi:hypothetical protein